MFTYDKNPDSKQPKSNLDPSSSIQEKASSTYHFIDNRPEAVLQRSLLNTINNYIQSKQVSPEEHRSPEENILRPNPPEQPYLSLTYKASASPTIQRIALGAGDANYDERRSTYTNNALPPANAFHWEAGETVGHLRNLTDHPYGIRSNADGNTFLRDNETLDANKTYNLVARQGEDASDKLRLLSGLSKLARAYAKAKSGGMVQELQAMHIDGKVVLTGNSDNETAKFSELLNNTKVNQLIEKFQLAYKEKAANIDFQVEESNLSAVRSWVWELRSSGLFTKKSIGAMVANSIGECVRAIDGNIPLIILKGGILGELWHAEQALLVVLGRRLKEGNIPNSLAITGVKEPCSKCYPVMMAHANAFAKSYGRMLAYVNNKGQNVHNDIVVAHTHEVFTEGGGDEAFAHFVHALQ